MRQILFLDIDGVLNSHRFFESLGERPSSADPETMARAMIDPAAVVLLDELLLKSGAAVVISSTWRRAYSLGAIGRALRANGFKSSRSIIGKTPVLADSIRGTEIQAWLDESREADPSIVILDDDEDMGLLKHRLVRTHYVNGLQSEHVEAALRLFGIARAA